MSDKWQVTNDKWQMTSDKWQVTNDKSLEVLVVSHYSLVTIKKRFAFQSKNIKKI